MRCGFCEFREGARSLVLPFLLLLFPTLCVLFACCGFLVGLGISKWQGLLALAITLAAGGVLTRGWRSRALVLSGVCGVFAVALALTGLFVMYSDPDVEWYHRPAVHLLTKGWNPVFESTPEQIEAFHAPKETSFSYRHVAYLPRGSWVLGAVLYRLFGYAEVGDAANYVFAVALFVVLWKVFAELYRCSPWLRACFVTLIVVSPEVVNCLVGGMNDGLFYMSFLLSAASALMLGRTGRLEWSPFFICGAVWMCNVKFSGVVCTCVGVLIVSAWLGWAAIRERSALTLKKWTLTVGVAGCLSLLVGFSPYLTNWVHYGSPFYPQHTFNKSLKLDSITYDFDIKNDDAKRMGYVGRNVYAYLSESLASTYYTRTSDTKRFSPQFEVSASGFGPIFRLVFVLSLALWVWRLRRSEATPVLLILLACALFQPTKYVGYGRYVSFLVVFPLMVLMEVCAEKVQGRGGLLRRVVGLLLAVVLWGSILCACPTRLAFKWYASDQNLALIEAARNDAKSVVVTTRYSTFHGLGDWWLAPQVSAAGTVASVGGRSYQAGRAPFVLHTQASSLERYVPFDMEGGAGRRGSFVGFFVREFLPGNLAAFPSYVSRVTRWRFRQLRRAWGVCPDLGSPEAQAGMCVERRL